MKKIDFMISPLSIWQLNFIEMSTESIISSSCQQKCEQSESERKGEWW